MKTGIIFKMRDLVSKMTDFKTILTVLSVTAAFILGVYQYTEEFADNVSDRIYGYVTQPTYKYIEFDLMKQLEKIKKDPDDLRASDIQKFAYYCSGYFGSEYRDSSENKIKIEKACNVINKMYADSAL